MNPYSTQALEIGADLSLIEAGFIQLWEQMPVRIPVRLEPLVPVYVKRQFIAKPNMPRCRAGRHAPCKNPATYPDGLCPSHFIFSVGHLFIQERPGVWFGGWMRCKNCDSRHRCEDHAKHPALKERCQGRDSR